MNLDALHRAHPYFAKFSVELPLQSILDSTEVGDTVLDPFCGSGTTLIAALSTQRNAVGIDANPLACLISRVKTTRLTDSDFKALKALREKATAFADKASGKSTLFHSYPDLNIAALPEARNFDSWFEQTVSRELQQIKALVWEAPSPAALDVAKLAFSRIIVRVSNQQGESVYRRVSKQLSPGKCWSLFIDAVGKLLESLSSLNATLDAKFTTQILNQDCRKFTLAAQTIDHVVTSPPYLNSWDYSLYQKFRMLWLDFDPKSYEQIEIGNHLRTLRDGAAEISRYTEDMVAVFRNLSVCLKQLGVCIFVNGESVVSGQVINTDEIIIASASKHGFVLIDNIKMRVLGPHYGNHASLSTRKVSSSIAREKSESFLVFQLQ